MQAQLLTFHGVMEEKGAYNRHARIPAGGAALAMPLLREAIRKIELDDGNEPLVIADYGSSQGKNSLASMQTAIGTMRERVGSDTPVFVYHVDQPTNDFNTLFAVLDKDPDRYARSEPNVFPCAIGRSFYEAVFPSNCVHLGWSSYAAVWLSRIPGPLPGHLIAHLVDGAAHTPFEHQAAQDWKTFLSLRARELRPGGRLVVVLPGLDDAGNSGLAELFNHANSVLAEMVNAGEIRAAERQQMVLGAYPRRTCELLAPFQSNRQFEGLTVEQCDLLPLPDPAWAAYEHDGNEEMLASRHALFFRSIFVPSMALSLADADDEEQRITFADRFESRLKRRMSEQPTALHSLVQIFVVAKIGST